MQYRYKILTAILWIISVSAGFTYAQVHPGISKREQIKANLTAEQKSLLEANRSSIAETRKAFKASLSKEQIEMLENSALSIEQKRANLKATLNAQQKHILGENQQMRLMQRQQFRSTLTMQQKQFMKKAYFNRMETLDTRPGLKRLPRRLRR